MNPFLEPVDVAAADVSANTDLSVTGDRNMHDGAQDTAD